RSSGQCCFCSVARLWLKWTSPLASPTWRPSSNRTSAHMPVATVLAIDDHADVHQTGGEQAGHRQHQLAHVSPYLLDAPACQRRRPQGRARAAETLLHQGHDGHLHAGSDFCETEGTVEGGGEDRSETR